MFDLAQTFSSNILPYEQMFDLLATSANKTYMCERKKAANQRWNMDDVHVFFFGYNTQKALCGLTLSGV